MTFFNIVLTSFNALGHKIWCSVTSLRLLWHFWDCSDTFTTVATFTFESNYKYLKFLNKFLFLNSWYIFTFNVNFNECKNVLKLLTTESAIWWQQKLKIPAGLKSLFHGKRPNKGQTHKQLIKLWTNLNHSNIYKTSLKKLGLYDFWKKLIISKGQTVF